MGLRGDVLTDAAPVSTAQLKEPEWRTWAQRIRSDDRGRLPQDRDLAIAGSMAAKKKVFVGPGTLPTHRAVCPLARRGVILGGLGFLPALALGPIAEHALIQTGTVFK
jgi:hypothetical protein